MGVMGQKSGAPTGHAFISYVREDRERVDRLQEALVAAGIKVWRDTDNLRPGQDWKIEISQAISNGSLAFIACLSGNTARREKSYQNEELILAAEQMRLRRPDMTWLIPVRFDDCDIPRFDLGAGRTLSSLQSVDLFGDQWQHGTERLITTVLSMPNQPPAAHGTASAATPGVTRRKPRWHALPGGQRAIPLMLWLIVISVAAYAVFRNSQGSFTASGSVTCESGRPVVGVWIAAANGQSESGFAHLGPPDPSTFSYPIGSSGTYSFLLTHGGKYAVHVGCGGSAGHWTSRDYSPLLSGRTAHLRCSDPTAPAVTGECTVSAGSSP